MVKSKNKILSVILRVVAVIAAVLVLFYVVFMMPRFWKTEVIENKNATNSYITDYLDTDVSAHRSGAGVVPENTMMAFEYVMENQDKLGVDTFEFDVQITSDGELILLHDLTYDDTTNAEEFFGKTDNYAAEITFEEARSLNFGEDFCDENGNYPYRGLRGDDIPDNLRVVRCEDVIDYIESNSKGEYKYIIEVKGVGENGNRAADRLYEVLCERNLKERTIWATQVTEVSEYMKATYPDMPRSASLPEVLAFYACYRLGLDAEILSPSYIALQIPFGDNLLNNIVNLGTKDFINYAHKHNFAVQYWTINEQWEMQELVENGADCIMSDYPQMVYDTVKGATK